MRVLFVMNGVSYGASGKPGVSGGDVILIEIARRLIQKGYGVHFLTSLAGKELCENMGLKAIYHISSTRSDSFITDYFIRSLTTIFPEILYDNSFDLVFSSCEHVYDVFPALRIKKKMGSKWIAMVHFVPPPPWVRMKAGKLNSILYYLNHMLGAHIIRNNADLVFAISKRTALDYIHRLKFSEGKMLVIPGGIDYNSIRRVALSMHGKTYDAVFMKRLHPMKGAFDVIKIWKNVVAINPKAKLLVIGDGPVGTVKEMYRLIKQFGLTKNVEMRGPIYDAMERFSLLTKAKIFLLPSYEENWAIVIGEALAAGLPVVAYELSEIKSIWNNYVIWIPRGDLRAFAEETIKLLSDSTYYDAHVGKGIDFMRQFDWDDIVEKIMNYVRH